MAESTKHISKKAGLPPGSLIHVGKRKTDKIKISVIDYNETEFTQIVCKNPKEIDEYKEKDTISWINIDGLHETNVIAEIGSYFGLHPLLVEDVLNTKHRPQMEEYSNHIFITLKMLGISKDKVSIISEQVSFVMGKGWILSFQEQEGDLFDNLRLILQENKGNIRAKGVDFLLYRLIDTVVDNYFFVVEHISELIEKIEEKVLDIPTDESIKEIHSLKKQLVTIRRLISPLREAVSKLQKNENNLLQESTIQYLRDVYEHIIHVNDSIENYRDMVASIMELYLSGVSNRMNQVMKMLTIIATIFIPLTFIVGVYGMNFENMPELKWKYGYLITWVVMLFMVIIMFRYFKRKRWL